jgi:conjugal transfer/entry exclusion protein
MSTSCTYSYKQWCKILKLLQRAKKSKTISVASLSGFKKIITQNDQQDIGQSGNSINTIDSAISQIRHQIDQYSNMPQISILLDDNIYYLIDKLMRRSTKLARPTTRIQRSQTPPS